MRMANARLARRITAGVITAGTLALLTTAPALAAKPLPHNGTATTCAMSAAGVGSALTVTGGGYQAGSSYRVELTWPSNAGVADTAAYADSSGSILVSSYAYWSGTYNASVYSTSGSRSLLASCSLTLS